MKYFTAFLFLFISCVSFSQDENLRNEDWIYENNIRSARFHVNGLPLSLPIIDLGKNSQLLLTFDDLDGDVKDYVYSVDHYNADWTKSDLLEMEYTEGFAEADIEEYEYAFNTLVEFTHYVISLPNEDLQLTKSGNYLLKIYDTEDDRKLVLTRRFVVAEPLVKIEHQTTRPSNTEKTDTHHEFDFTIKHDQINIRSPLVDLKATIIQNGRWDTAIRDVQPRYSRGDISTFDYQDKIVFPAGKEFRYADLRSVDYKRPSVNEVIEDEEGYIITLAKDKKRVFKGFSSQADINGNFIFDSVDDNISFEGNNSNPLSYYKNTSEDYLAGPGASVLRSDYATVIFTLESPTEYYDDDIYIFGKMTDWQIKPEYKLIYNDNYNAYIGEVFLKQGFYNYYYASVQKKGGKPTTTLTEGNWHETNNEYTIILYYRAFGERYDRVIGAYGFDSGAQ